MNKKLKRHLEETIRISQKMLKGELFHVVNSEIDCCPVGVSTKTAMKKKGYILKRGAKKVGTWSFNLCTANGTGGGDLYLISSFKRKVSK